MLVQGEEHKAILQKEKSRHADTQALLEETRSELEDAQDRVDAIRRDMSLKLSEQKTEVRMCPMWLYNTRSSVLCGIIIMILHINISPCPLLITLVNGSLHILIFFSVPWEVFNVSSCQAGLVMHLGELAVWHW